MLAVTPDSSNIIEKADRAASGFCEMVAVRDFNAVFGLLKLPYSFLLDEDAKGNTTDHRLEQWFLTFSLPRLPCRLFQAFLAINKL